MKKWLALTLLLFCIPALVWGWGTVIISGSSSSSSGELSLKDSSSATSNYEHFGNDSTTKYVTSKVTTTGSYTLKKVYIYLKKIGSPNATTVYCDIYRTDGTSDTAPTDKVSTDTPSISVSSITTDCAKYEFDFPSGVTIDSANYSYFPVLHVDSTGPDTSNEVRTCNDSGGYYFRRSPDSSNWSSVEPATIAYEFWGE